MFNKYPKDQKIIHLMKFLERKKETDSPKIETD